MTPGLLSNERLPRGINWTLLSDPLFAELERLAGARRLAPPPVSPAAAGEYWRIIGKARRVNALFSMQGRARPDWRLQTVSAAAGRCVRAVFHVDPWRQSLGRISRIDRLLGHDPVFIPYREAFQVLAAGTGGARYHYLPFAADTRAFADHGRARDIDILWMGRRHEPLHRAILAHAHQAGLSYVYRETMGFIDDPQELGRIAARARYFVATPPDLDNAARTGGFSPLVLRYLEGPAAGCRLLGVLPGSGEFEAILPRAAMLEVAPDGSDFAARFAADQADAAGWAAAALCSTVVRRDHGWDARAGAIIAQIAAACARRCR